MSKFVALATLSIFLLSPVAAHAAAPKIAEGTMVYGTNGQQLAPVYRINLDGSVQMIMAGRLLTISPASLSDVHGKLTSSSNENDLQR